MGISVEDAVKELQARETVFVAYSQVTKLPYVTCGEESYNDQVWLFAEEETLKEFGKKKLEDKVLLPVLLSSCVPLFQQDGEVPA